MNHKKEFEYKLEIPKDYAEIVFEKLNKMDGINSCQFGIAQKIELLDKYYDTSDFSLLKEGFFLRMRKRDDVLLITLKELIGRTVSSLNRMELEKSFNDNNIREVLNILVKKNILKNFTYNKFGEDMLLAAGLKNILSIVNHRTQRKIIKNDKNIGVIDLDKVVFKKGIKSLKYRLIEIESLGKDSSFYIKNLVNSINVELKNMVKPTNLSKFEKALDCFQLLD